MRTADLSELRDLIAEIARKSKLGPLVQDVIVEAEEDVPGGGFLRVILTVKHMDNVKTADLEPLVRSIEDDVAEKDDRYPSVRFSEAKAA